MKKFFQIILVGVLTIGWFASASAQRDKLGGAEEEVITESSTPDDEIFIDDIVAKRLVEENQILEFVPIRESDIAWEKRIQRVIDTREKLNQPFRAQEGNLFETLRQLINDGAITAFSDEEFKQKFTKEEIESKMSKVDTITDFNYDTYTEEIKVVKNDINWEDIYQYRVKEIWFFDKQRSVIDVRILGIAPIYARPEDVDAGIPPYPLFWVYYPQAREPLSKFRVFNDENDMAPTTWADLFDTRVFSSYIFKRSNSQDFRLKDYFDPTDERSGRDMLLLSQKIKNELINFEQDLWEY